jgi:hypothetical protein
MSDDLARTGNEPDPATAREHEQASAALLAALRAPTASHELAQREHYLAAFARARTPRISPPRSRRRFAVVSLRTASNALVAACVSLAVAGTATAAYTGSLPRGLQDLAHRSVGAPTAGTPRTTTAQPTGEVRASASPTSVRSPSAAPPAVGSPGNAAHPASRGLCVAFTKGKLPPRSSAARHLSEAAGGVSNVPVYCASVLADHPAATRPERRNHRPSAHPTGRSNDRRADPPGSHPADKPGKAAKAAKAR